MKRHVLQWKINKVHENSLPSAKRVKMFEENKKVWKPKPFDYLVKRLQHAHSLRREALSCYDVPFRWKHRRSSGVINDQAIPPDALTKFREYLYSQKKTHPVFYPTLAKVVKENFSSDDTSKGEINSEAKSENSSSSLDQLKKSNGDSPDKPPDYDDATQNSDCGPSKDEEMDSSWRSSLSLDENDWKNKKDEFVEKNHSTSQELTKRISPIAPMEVEIVDDEESMESPDGILCPVCNKSFALGHIESHAIRCASKYFKD